MEIFVQNKLSTEISFSVGLSLKTDDFHLISVYFLLYRTIADPGKLGEWSFTFMNNMSV